MNDKNGKKIQEYSVDYDMSMVIKHVFRTFYVLLGGLIALEAVNVAAHIIFSTDHKMPDEPMFLTKEIIHTIFGFVGGWGGNIVTNFFAKMIAEKLNQRKEEDDEDGKEKT